MLAIFACKISKCATSGQICGKSSAKFDLMTHIYDNTHILYNYTIQYTLKYEREQTVEISNSCT